MAKNYRYVSAIGQINEMACWAACMTWWYKAIHGYTPSQQKLWDRYKHLELPAGGMSDAGMIHMIRENGMLCETYPNASSFTVPVIKERLKYSPVYTAYREAGTGKKHVNVIYGASGESSWAEVRVMEPQAELTGDGVSYKGRHEKKSLSDFNLIGTVFIGSLKPSFWDNLLDLFD